MSSRTFTFQVSAPLVGAPSWAQQPIGQFVDLGAASAVGPVMENGAARGLFSYSGGSLHPTTLQYYHLGGGHGDYSGNEIYKLDLASQTPSWSIVQPSTPSAQRVSDASASPKAYNLDGKPISRHTWSGTLQVLPNRGTAGRVLLVGCNSATGYGGGVYGTMDEWDIATGQWTWINPDPVGTPIGPNPTLPAFSVGRESACRDSRNNVWTTAYGSFGPARMYNSTAGTISTTAGYSGSWGDRVLVYDSTRDRMVAFPTKYRSSGLCFASYWNALDGSGFVEMQWAQNTVTSSRTPTVSTGSYIYEPNLDRYIQLVGNALNVLSWTAYRVHSIHPQTWEVTDITSQFSGVFPSMTDSGGGRAQPNSRWCYIPQYRGAVFCNSVNKNWTFVRLS